VSCAEAGLLALMPLRNTEVRAIPKSSDEMIIDPVQIVPALPQHCRAESGPLRRDTWDRVRDNLWRLIR
jgi:hypothetical protein